MDSCFLKSTGDTTDRSADIEKLLQEYKVCILAPGTYYVSGVKMPDDSMLMGMGAASQMILDPGVEEGYAILIGSRCTIKDLFLRGSAEDIERPTEVGTRHGIGFLGDATTTNPPPQHKDSTVRGLQIRSFTGGGITCEGTGYNIDCSMCVSDCRIHNCGAGINISRFSEYHKFSNVVCNRNLYGCINNGGNNVFTGCAFDGNTLGYLIDNSQGQSKNNAHGSCVACTFNHTNANRGIGVKIVGSKPGYVFSACQMFFSDIEVEDSCGIQFCNFNFGKDQKIRVKGGGTIVFSGCIFSKNPSIAVEDNPHVRVLDCYTKTGDPVELLREEGTCDVLC